MIGMPRVQKRKYEKIDQAEIDLVIKCTDSHEFYERYRDEFPTRKKGIDSISKIWKRRGEFIKKQEGSQISTDAAIAGSTHELEALLSTQTRILTDLSGMMKDQIRISKEILACLQKPVSKGEETVQKIPVEKPAEPKEPVKKTAHEKPRADIMIGS